jgi:hypothetical protein
MGLTLLLLLGVLAVLTVSGLAWWAGRLAGIILLLGVLAVFTVRRLAWRVERHGEKVKDLRG